jgi:hypothetical protein
MPLHESCTNTAHRSVVLLHRGQRSGPYRDTCKIELALNLSLMKCYLRVVEMNPELMHEWRNRKTSNFSGEDCLFHGEQCSRKSVDAQTRQLTAGLQPFPSSGNLDDESRKIEIGLQAVAQIGYACST